MHTERGGTSSRPVLTLLTLGTFVASLTQAEATDGVTVPVACTAVARVDAVRPPVSTVTGCNRAQCHPVCMSCTASSETRGIVGQGQGRDQWTKGRQRTHIPLWQLRPVHPGAQLQRPVAGWQCPSLAQAHLIWQPAPNQPAGQAVGGKEGEHGG